MIGPLPKKPRPSDTHRLHHASRGLQPGVTKPVGSVPPAAAELAVAGASSNSARATQATATASTMGMSATASRPWIKNCRLVASMKPAAKPARAPNQRRPVRQTSSTSAIMQATAGRRAPSSLIPTEA